MDFGILASVALLAIWAVVALGFSGPGYVHLLLTVGVTLLIWRIVVRGSARKQGKE
jgi:Flp pilus assembly protein TadB